MMLDQYKAFDADYRATYGAYFDAYPHAMLLFDLALRHYHAGRPANYLPKIRKLVGVNAARVGYAYLMRAGLRVLSLLPWQRPQAIWVGELKRFPYLKRAIIRGARAAGYEVRTNDGSKNPLRYLRLQSFPFHNLVVNSLAAKRLLKHFDVGNPLAFFEDAEKMSALEALVRREIDYAAWCMQVLNIKHIVEGEDQSPGRQLLAQAAKRVGAKYHVFAHGYVQDPCGISIVPVRGDYLYLWSPSQARDIAAVLPAEQRSKVVDFGYPAVDEQWLAAALPVAGKRRRVLYVASPLAAGGGAEKKQATFRQIVDLCAALEFDLAVRLHPKDRGNKQIQRLLKAVGAIDSRRAPLRDLLNSDIVIGDNSSMLFEAAVLGKPALQIAELRQFDFDGVRAVPAAELQSTVEALLESAPAEGARHSLVADFREEVGRILS